eukprot:5936410-Pyramimonas_sp.AAC.1
MAPRAPSKAAGLQESPARAPTGGPKGGPDARDANHKRVQGNFLGQPHLAQNPARGPSPAVRRGQVCDWIRDGLVREHAVPIDLSPGH